MSLPTPALIEVCSAVVRDYRIGKWRELSAAARATIRASLLGILLERCPGFSTREYRAALNACLLLQGRKRLSSSTDTRPTKRARKGQPRQRQTPGRGSPRD
jgi:hypothetical protein